ncbi:MAG: hypothetical protein II901_04215 [Paludibacteraceae bacterium]|nr:hypothetical protein [Paludibacteraceae bacterium]MBQ6983553.1 hypothetical protein [Paludibacteraceae bacterium]
MCRVSLPTFRRWLLSDQEAFLAQRDEPNGKRTMRSYLWSLELASYDESHNG